MTRTLRILVTGSRGWTDRAALKRALAHVGEDSGLHPCDVTVVHGGCRTGADLIVDEIARDFGCRVEVHPAQWQDGPSAGPRRNAHMVALGADVCLAFPLGESRGTRGCMELARRAGIPVVDYGVPTGAGERP